jgi:RNA polymerase sigma factor (sigma-70 family)
MKSSTIPISEQEDHWKKRLYEGDITAISEIFAYYAPHFLRVFKRMFYDAPDAEDIAQEGITSAMESLQKMFSKGLNDKKAIQDSLKTYLNNVIRNACFKYLEKMNRLKDFNLPMPEYAESIAQTFPNLDMNSEDKIMLGEIKGLKPFCIAYYSLKKSMEVTEKEIKEALCKLFPAYTDSTINAYRSGCEHQKKEILKKLGF